MKGTSLNDNTGHGHVWKRPDGLLARCGGIKMCKVCARDAEKMTVRSGQSIRQAMINLGWGVVENEEGNFAWYASDKDGGASNSYWSNDDAWEDAERYFRRAVERAVVLAAVYEEYYAD